MTNNILARCARLNEFPDFLRTHLHLLEEYFLIILMYMDINLPCI